jgi:sugar transferase (PEP-CTERM/EpsH1 system associated)
MDGILAAKLARTKYVVHGEHGREYRDLHGKSFLRNFGRRLLAWFTDRIVTVSDDLRNWLVREVGIPHDKVITIINGVDTTRFFPPADKSQAKKHLGIDPETFVIGSVGRLDKVKNYRMLLEAILLARQCESSFLVLIIGDGPERYDLEYFARTHSIPNVQFLGQRDNVYDYLKAFDLFVLTSLAEGISNTILEAMATGLPVLATGVGGNPEIVQDDVTGSLIPPRDTSLLWKKMNEYFNNNWLCQRHGLAGRLRCEEMFSLEQMVVKYDSLYSSLMQSR